MEFIKTMAFLLFMTAAFVSSRAAEKQVDWTVGKDYKDWASGNKFEAGDTIVFQYDPQHHNVLEVDKKGFKSCSSASPMASYSSGRDSIALTTPGSYYFICGYPGHCEAGQKLKIKVGKGEGDGDGDGGQSAPNTPGQTTNPCPPGQTTPNINPGQYGPRMSSSPHSTANWLTLIKACLGLFFACLFCG